LEELQQLRVHLIVVVVAAVIVLSPSGLVGDNGPKVDLLLLLLLLMLRVAYTSMIR
jgi:hypothetical protein